MTVNLGVPEAKKSKLTPRIIVIGVGGGGCNAVNTMIESGLKGVEYAACNTDAQSLENNKASEKIQLGLETTEGLGAGSDPIKGKAAAEESYNEICEYIDGAHMAFIAAGMGGGTGTGAVSTIAKACKEKGLLTVAVVTKPFQYEGKRKMVTAEKGIEELKEHVDTIIIIPNQNLFIVTDPKTSEADCFSIVDQVLHAGVRAVTDLIIQPGLINLDFADIRTTMSEMGRAVFGTGEASGERRAIEAAEAAISNPLLERVSLDGAKGLLVNISGGSDMAMTEVAEAAERINQEIDPDVTNSKFGNTIDKNLDGIMRVSVIATGIENVVDIKAKTSKEKIENESFFRKEDNKIMPKFAEQTDLEDFTNPVIEIKKDFSNKDDLDQKHLQKKPDGILKEFIKKVSSIKIFNFGNKKEEEVNNSLDDDHSTNDDRSTNFLEKESVPSNEEIMKETGTDEEVVINKETITNYDKNEEKEEERQEITNNKETITNYDKNEEKEEERQEITNNKEIKLNLEEKKVEIKPEKNKHTLEINKDQKKTVQVQSEMPGLDEKIEDLSDNKDSKEKENLEIPSFLRNQSN